MLQSFFPHSANGNGHYAGPPMQQTQSPYMGVNNMQSSGYSKSPYSSGHIQRAPIYDGTFFFKNDAIRQNLPKN